MKYIFQFARILAFCILGELLHWILPLPIPASIYGLVLLLLALKLHIVALEQVKEAGSFLSAIFPMLFVPAAVGVMELWEDLSQILIPVLIALFPVTILVIGITGRTVQSLMGRKEKGHV